MAVKKLEPGQSEAECGIPGRLRNHIKPETLQGIGEELRDEEVSVS